MLSTTMNRVIANMRALEISIVTLAKIAKLANLADVGATKLSYGFSDTRYLGSETERDLDILTSRLVRYREALLPLPMPKSPDDVWRLLDANVPPDEIAHLVSLIFTSRSESNG